MYVRWKKRESRARRGYVETVQNPDPPVILTAMAVESVRVDGKPRQRIVAYLGTIWERNIEHVWRRHYFWEAADKALNAMPQPHRSKIEAELLAKVKRPTEAEFEVFRLESEALTRAIRAAFKGDDSGPK
jgi:hypothetical protein